MLESVWITLKLILMVSEVSCKIDWDYELTGTVQNSWDIFKAKLHELERRYVTNKQGTLAKRNKFIWMTRKAMKLVEKKHRIFRKYNDVSHPAYVKASKMASSEVKRAKYNFESKMARNIKTGVKSFYAYVRQKSCSRPRVGPLKDGTGQVVSEACHMVEIFNDFFLRFSQRKTARPFRMWLICLVKPEF